MNLKAEYNKYLKRFYKADKWFGSPERTPDEIEKYMKPFLQIIENLNKILTKMKCQGIKYTDEEVVNGFKGVD